MGRTAARDLLRAAVVVPPIEDFYFTPHRFSALGALIVRDLLEEQGVRASMHLFPLAGGSRISLPPFLSHLSPFLIADETGRSSYFRHFQRFGPPNGECVESVLRAEPQICFISCFAWCYSQQVIDFCALMKDRRPDIPLICGGAGVSAYPEYFVHHRGAIDFALVGEAEVCLPEFLRELRVDCPQYGVVPNLWWRENGEVKAPGMVKRTAATEIRIRIAIDSKSKSYVSATTSLSRGCSRSCRFCSGAIAHGGEFRHPGVDNMLKSLLAIPADCRNGHSPVRVNLEDDNLLLDAGFLLEAMEIFPKVLGPCTFCAENGIDYSMLTPDLTKALIEKGMRRFCISLGSASPQVLGEENRGLDLCRYERILAVLSAHSVPSTTYFIAGLEGDTRESLAGSLTYVHKARTLSGISLFYPVPGLPRFMDRARFSSVDPGLCAGSAAYPWTGSLETRTMITAFRISRFINLSKTVGVTPSERLLLDRSFATRALYCLRKRGKSIEVLPVPGMDQELVDLFFRDIGGFGPAAPVL